MAQGKNQGFSPAVIAGGVAAALLIGFVAGRATAPEKRGGAAEAVAVAAAGEAPAAGTYVEKKLDLDPSPYKGPEDAPIVIYEISDFQCPFCSRVLPNIDKVVDAYPDDVRLVFKHNALSFHKDARLAAIASMAAARQGHYWKYHDTLFANQKALGRDQLIKYAEDIGMDMVAFKKDLDDPKLGLKVDNDQAAAVALGATGTPAFFINGVKLSGAKPFEDFKAEIDKQLASAADLEAEGVPRNKIARRLAAQSGGTATKFLKYIVDEAPAPKVAAPQAKPKAEDDTSTVWAVPVDADTEHVKGPKYAPVTIVEFSDFECPFCSKVGPTYKKIAETYGDKVRVVFKHNPLPFHKNAPLASEASLAAGAQGKFWEMHDLLFENQKALLRTDLEGYAEQLGLDLKKFNAALDGHLYSAKIADDQEVASLVQAKGTPNHFINGRKLTGAKPFEEFKAIIDEELAKTDKLIAGGTALDGLYDVLMKGAKTFNPLDPKVNAISDADGTPTKGAQSARIAIVEYSDFQCPFCSRVGDPLKKLVSKYPNDVKMSFKQFPLSFHKEAQKAAEASLAAHAQGRFWDMHDIMFQNQKALNVDQLVSYAEQIGLDVAKFKAELDSGMYAAKVKADMAEGSRIGVRGTPSVYVGGRKYSPSGGYTVEGLEKVLAREFGLQVK